MEDLALDLEPAHCFEESLKQRYAAFVRDDFFKNIRENAKERFLSLGAPTKKDEVFRYVPLRSLYAKGVAEAPDVVLSKGDAAPFIYPECRNSCLVFVNGRFCKNLSSLDDVPQSVRIQTLEEAAKTYGTFLERRFSELVKQEKDPFSLVNLSLWQDGLFVYIPPKTVFKTPVQILHLTSCDQKDPLLLPLVQIFAGSFSEGTFISSKAHLAGAFATAFSVADFALEEGARIRYLQEGIEKSSGEVFFEAVRSSLKANSFFEAINVSSGKKLYRSDYYASLLGEGAEAFLNGLWMAKEKQEVHTHIVIDHKAPNCCSRQLFKTALEGVSHSSFEGKILVRENALKTNAFQLNNNLLLSDFARADSKPNLEIFADDVKASHGATVGKLDSDELFYLKSRGFSSKDAKSLLIYSFCKEVIDKALERSFSEKASRAAKELIER